MIEGKTKSGIAFKIDERIREDWRFQKKLTKLISLRKKISQDAESSESASDDLAAIYNVISEMEELVFGGPEGAEAFENVVAQTYGGICSADIFQKEFLEIISATKDLKN